MGSVSSPISVWSCCGQKKRRPVKRQDLLPFFNTHCSMQTSAGHREDKITEVLRLGIKLEALPAGISRR